MLKKVYGVKASSVSHTCVFLTAFDGKYPDYKRLKRRFQPYFTKNSYGTIHTAVAFMVKNLKDILYYMPNYTPRGRSHKEKIKLISLNRKKIRLEVIISL
ncbi:MAG: hypothetical protein WC608_02510 [Parcubacteria group bacterium]